MHTCSVFGEFILGESETKPIKPINHEQPTNWRLSISTAYGNCQQMAVGKGTDWVQAPTLAQQGGSGAQRKMLVDDEDVIANVRHERWQLRRPVCSHSDAIRQANHG